jgi:hypothetical protein
LRDVRCRPDDRHVTALRQLDNEGISSAWAIVILGQTRPEPPGFRSHDGIGLGIVIGFSAENLAPYDGLLKILLTSVQIPVDYETQKAGQPLIA